MGPFIPGPNLLDYKIKRKLHWWFLHAVLYLIHSFWFFSFLLVFYDDLFSLFQHYRTRTNWSPNFIKNTLPVFQNRFINVFSKQIYFLLKINIGLAANKIFIKLYIQFIYSIIWIENCNLSDIFSNHHNKPLPSSLVIILISPLRILSHKEVKLLVTYQTMNKWERTFQC